MTNPADYGTTAPRCYRHADRETYISCQRCGRPICPDCMQPASVGFHCPECVTEARRTTPQARTAAGGLLPNRVGMVTMVLIGINVVAFLGQLATGGAEAGELTRWGAMLGDSDTVTGVAEGAWWRIATSGFLHVGFVHILLNMYALYLFGPLLERMLGHVRFIAMYVTSLVGGSLFVYLLSPPEIPTLGASGAIFGLLGCTLVLFLKNGYDVRFLVALLAINGVITVVFGGISWQAHAGGFVAGALCGLALGFAPQRARNYVQAGAIGLLWLMMIVGFVIGTAAITL